MLSRKDDGYTLVELLVAIVIIGVIVAPIANAVIGYLHNTDTTAARLNESHDQQIAAAYWQQDVSSIGVRSSTYDQASHNFPLQQSVNNAFPCSPAPAGPLVTLSWNQYDSSGSATLNSVAYYRDGTATQLLRVHCTGSTVDSTATLAHDLDPAVTPTVQCDGAACTSTVPAAMSLELAVKDPSGKGQPYTVKLTGQRRQT
jgi:prepilin-type N-terminal cleavage/methylation domain-containing protein